MIKLMIIVDRKKIDWSASAWDLKSLEFLDQYNLPFHKIASAMIVDQVFLNEVAKRKYIYIYINWHVNII